MDLTTETNSSNRTTLCVTATEFVPSIKPQPEKYYTNIISVVKQTRLALETILHNGFTGKDEALFDIMIKDPSNLKYVKISYLLQNYPELGSNVSNSVLMTAIRDSMRIKLSPCNTSVRYNENARDVKKSVYIDGFPETNDVMVVYNQFSQFGDIRSIIPCSHVKEPFHSFSGYAELPLDGTLFRAVLVEFYSKSSAISVAELLRSDNPQKSENMVEFKDYHIMPMFAYLPIIKKKKQSAISYKNNQQNYTKEPTPVNHLNLPPPPINTTPTSTFSWHKPNQVRKRNIIVKKNSKFP